MANQKNTSKDVKYIDRDFDSLKKGLIEFTKATQTPIMTLMKLHLE